MIFLLFKPNVLFLVINLLHSTSGIYMKKFYLLCSLIFIPCATYSMVNQRAQEYKKLFPLLTTIQSNNYKAASTLLENISTQTLAPLDKYYAYCLAVQMQRQDFISLLMQHNIEPATLVHRPQFQLDI